MLSRRMQFAAIIDKHDKIYVFGGAEDGPENPNLAVSNAVEVYDPKANQWSTKSPMPVKRKSQAAVLASDGRIYILGGSDGFNRPPLKTVFIYNPKTDTWKKGPDMQIPRAALAAVATPDGKIYAIGGTDVGAYGKRELKNYSLPDDKRGYTGKVQDTIEILDITKLKQ